MKCEDKIRELFERIEKLEEKVAMLEKSDSGEQTRKVPQEVHKTSKKYRLLSAYLKEREDLSIELNFKEIESILDFTLAKSAMKHKEFWANSTSHSIALSWLSVGYRTVKVHLDNDKEKSYVVFKKTKFMQNPHAEFWDGFNGYAQNDGSILTHFKKLHDAIYESRYVLNIVKNIAEIAFCRNEENRNLTIEFFIRDKDIFDILMIDKVSIENELGQLKWQRLDDVPAVKISYEKEYADDADNDVIYKWMIETAIKFKTVFERYI